MSWIKREILRTDCELHRSLHTRLSGLLLQDTILNNCLHYQGHIQPLKSFFPAVVLQTYFLKDTLCASILRDSMMKLGWSVHRDTVQWQVNRRPSLLKTEWDRSSSCLHWFMFNMCTSDAAIQTNGVLPALLTCEINCGRRVEDTGQTKLWHAPLSHRCCEAGGVQWILRGEKLPSFSFWGNLMTGH